MDSSVLGIENLPLLTLDEAKARALDIDFRRCGSAWMHGKIVPHWLLQAAIRSGAVVYDRSVWGQLALSAHFTEANRHEITFVITYGLDGAPNVVDGKTTDYPSNINQLDDAAQNAVPSTLVPSPESALTWLALLVDSINELHDRARALVRWWPR
ncbi:hypothetical protein CH294_26405 [Rhodococcus sp. 14-2483-1-1]|uniref:hypothetical protein n=1 Tax=unclassified Rhodococcus (in: high G+C Gram-positive bacteria) TaxID=192944 RepID=UPI000B9B254C|nr:MULTISPECIES: hypothetical protein [unclassified Rhodococcus (in: high G+C Gram-positive bacteria)]OZC94873.1 hypothetical protein CH275_28345 [Rhodococcus sp. 06-235-1A]OZD64766.1 hypothetical protein CH271_21210 [Rhodococcus sp. 05-340-2]OZD71704.1 hypothetical protein CH272_24365 [Rhodococcus sp. 05-340-1]OZE28819.1 hypothetical protein CH262_02215 [Rhodococcus sp. 05-2255-1e]OZF29007.1 hypothetical protein CH294_26405 [Rhodococcus sp. 14-2483-1-1]